MKEVAKKGTSELGHLAMQILIYVDRVLAC